MPQRRAATTVAAENLIAVCPLTRRSSVRPQTPRVSHVTVRTADTLSAMSQPDDARRSTPSAGARASIPLAAPVLAFGVSFGALAGAAGIDPLFAIAMSATTFAGSAQFAAASILTEGGGAVAALVAGILLNTRYLPIGISLAPALGGPSWKRFLHAQLAVDESWAIAHTGGGRFDKELLFGAGLTLYVAWLIGTSLGVAAGGFLGDPARLGLDAAFPALFLVLVAPRLREELGRWAAIGGAAIALTLVPLAPAGVPILVAVIPPLLIARFTWHRP